MANTRIIDLSHPINEGTPPWPGTPPVEISIFDRAEWSTPQQRHSNASRLAMNIHCGTHMDAPFHFMPGGKTIDQVPLEWTYGWATLARLANQGPGTEIQVADLAPYEASLRRTRKAILQTGWSERWRQADFFTDFPVVTAEAARFLVDCGVHLVGVETASVDMPPHDTHVVLLGSDCLIVECLRGLAEISTPEFLFSATPLNVEQRDGSPVRAVAILSQN
jgi:kynurenine formamidase